MYELTIFKNQFDNKTHRKMEFPDWESFVDTLRQLHKIPREGKRDAPLISPAIYKEGTTRANRNVDYWGGWCCIDVDDIEINSETLEDELDTIIGNFRYVCYSTASSSHNKPKFRVVFDLAGRVPESSCKELWFAIQQRFKSIGDEQTKDGSRMYFVPARYTGAYNFFFCRDGDPLPVQDLLEEFPYVQKTGNSFLDNLPEELQKQVIEHRKAQLDNTTIKWSGYNDCPFFPKALAAKYMNINETGWYHTMYCIMVAIASNALKEKYPISASQIEQLCREFDMVTGSWYENRPMDVEANSALQYAYRNINF